MQFGTAVFLTVVHSPFACECVPLSFYAMLCGSEFFSTKITRTREQRWAMVRFLQAVPVN